MMLLPHTKSIPQLQLQELWWDQIVLKITFILKVGGRKDGNLKVESSLLFCFKMISGAGGSKNSIVGPNRFCGKNLNFVGGQTLNEPIVGKIL